ncbi:hypothetical protein GCM10009758_32040 [Microbacterium hatanonis]
MLVLLVGIWPASRIKVQLLRVLGWQVGKGGSVGPGLYFAIDSVVLGENARIGPFNVFKGLAAVEVDDFGRIGQWNWLSAASPLRAAGAPGTVSIGRHSALTSRHYIDASGGISIGHHTTVAGVRSTFITHGIDWRTSSQTYRSITIGDYSLISSNVQITPGSQIGSRVVVGMGATVAGSLSDGGLLVQERAREVKENLQGDYFKRDVGFIDYVRGLR